MLLAVATACADGVGPTSGDAVALRLALQAPAGVSSAETTALQSAFDRVDTYRVAVRDSANDDVLLVDTVSVPAGLDEHRLDFGLPSSSVGLPVLVSVVGLESGLELYRASGYTAVQAVSDANGGPASAVLSVRYTGPGVRGKVVDDFGAGLAGVGVGLYQGSTLLSSVPTEPDGSYLFLDLGTGLYSVEPVPPAGAYVCPGARDLTVLTNVALVADFLVKDVPCQIDVLVLSGGDVDNTQVVADMFAGTPGVTVETFFFVSGTPGLGALRQHDVVLLFANGIFDETVAVGDELAQYVAEGGNLVIGSFYWQGRSDSELPTPGWGDLETIDPFLADTVGFTRQGGATYEANDLGTIALPTHPLIQGVSTLTSISGFSAGVLAKPSATVVASWTDGAPLVAYRTLGAGQRVVAVSLFPAANIPDQVGGDARVLWENAVVWAGSAGGPVP